MVGRGKRWAASVVVALLVATGALAGTASAHWLQRPSSGGDWFLDGVFYSEGPIDPFNVAWYGGGDVTLSSVYTHLMQDWDGRFGRMTNPGACASNQLAKWRHRPGFSQDENDGQLRATYGGGSFCRKQYHMRLWDDKEHFEGTRNRSRHPARNDWVAAGIHREKLAGFGHEINMDWDRVRVRATIAMRKHMHQRRWRWHPGARRRLQGKSNSGFVARISRSHR